PYQSNKHDTDGERKAQKIVRVFCPFRPRRETVGADQRQQQRPPEGNVETRQAEDDEADRSHPVHKALEPIEANDLAPGKTALKLHRSAHEIENDEHGEKAQDRDCRDPAQRHIVEILPIAPGRMLEHIGLGIRDRAETLNRLELIEELLLLDRAAIWIDLCS